MTAKYKTYLTPAEREERRLEIRRRLDLGERQIDIARAMGITQACVSQWKARSEKREALQAELANWGQTEQVIYSVLATSRVGTLSDRLEIKIATALREAGLLACRPGGCPRGKEEPDGGPTDLGQG